MKISNWKISRKLAAAFGAVVLTIAMVGAVAVVELGFIEKERGHLDKETSSLASLRVAKFYLARQENSFRGWVVSQNPYYLDRLAAHRENYRKSLNEAAAINADKPEVLAKIENARAAADRWFEVVDAGRKRVARGGGIGEVVTLIDKDGPADDAMGPAEDAIDGLIDTALKSRDDTSKELGHSVQTAVILVVGGIIAAALLAAALGWWLARLTSRPIVALTDGMQRLAKGDVEIDVTGVERQDEIGAMARALGVFKDNAVALKAAAEAEARAAAEQQQVVDETARGLAALAAGDLAHRIEANFPGQYQKLQADFNSAMAKLEEAMVVLNTNASAMQTGAGEISQAADDLSRRTEQQAATLEETAAALDEITATVRRTAEGAERANTAVSSAKNAAEQSGMIVGQAINAMGEIERSSDQIGQIIGVIDEIAFQTNLLALNAGVEAARAGDAGRGFAVVASEVRALAQRSAEAAKEIKSLIATSSGHVKDGVGLVGQTGEALTAIVERVSEINGLMAEITASAQEQATALTQVNTAVNQMDQTTQQNAAMVEQSTAASHNLAQEAEELASLVGKFRVSGAAAEQARAGSTNPVRKAQARVAEFARQPARRRAAAGGAALARSAEPTWEEF